MKSNIYKHISFVLVLLCCLYTKHASGYVEVVQEVSLLQQKDTQKIDSLSLEKEKALLNWIIEKQQKNEDRFHVLLILIGVTLSLALLLCIFYFRNNKKNSQLKEIRKLLEKSSNDNKKEQHKKLHLDTVTVHYILKHLEAFENEQGFLTPNISLYQLAKKLQTNTKYLSRVINSYKLKSFRNYINDLRIEYTLDRLKGKSRYKKYTVKAMAKEVGFSTTEAFSKAFRKKTGTTVSDFLESIN